jgi:hypothetical protein
LRLAPLSSSTPIKPPGSRQAPAFWRDLQVHDVDAIVLDMAFQRAASFGPSVCGTEMKFSIPIVSSTWPPKRSAATPSADALARGIDRRRRPGRTAADDQHIERLLRRDLFRRSCNRAGIQLRDDLLQLHATGGEHLAVQIDRRHRHHLAGVNLVLEQRAVDRRMADTRVEHRHKVECLHHIRAVLARQREIGLEHIVAIQRPHLIEQLRAALDGWPPTCSSASTSEVNSWPSGMPANVTPMSVPVRRIRKEGLRGSVPVRDTLTLSDKAAISSSNSASSADFAPSSSDATSSIGSRMLTR